MIRHRPSRRALLALAAVGLAVLSAAGRKTPAAQQGKENPIDKVFAEGAKGWINSKPIRPSELKGKIILLDFWTYCCINCHHVLPDLEKLEQKYRNELVVIGVHTAKFPAERITANIKKKVDEYGIKHPVVNDADQIIWNGFGVQGWPTLVLIDANGNYVGALSGEGNYDVFDKAIAKLVAMHKEKGELDERPLVFFPESESEEDRPLSYPGKLLADKGNDRLYITDTGHNRIVVTDLAGKFVDAIGSGEAGLADGPFASARFHRPQGLCLFDDRLYVADTENHTIRAVDLESKSVVTVAGDGEQAVRDPRTRYRGPAKSSRLNSPWDLLPIPGTRTLIIAMAGPHQIWTLDLAKDEVAVFAGSGVENIVDGPPESAAFAQPSGLATDGTHLFVADSEVSGIRSIPFARPEVSTVVGTGLFGFGDKDGRGEAVRLQHCLGLAYGDGTLYIADTYNNKIKACDPKTKAVKTFAGTGKPGLADSPAAFFQPGGLSLAGGTLYVADTNNHAIRTIDLASRTVSTLALDGVTPPAPPLRKPSFPNAIARDLPPVEVAPGERINLHVALDLPQGFKLNPDAPTPIRYLVEAPERSDALGPDVSPTGTGLKVDAPTFEIPVALANPGKAGEELNLKLSVSAFICRSGANGLCRNQNYVWNVPVRFAEGGPADVELTGKSPAKTGR